MITNIKKILKQRGWTQKKLAEMTDIGEYKISLICSGKVKNFQMETAMKICEKLECSLDEAFGDILFHHNQERKQ